MFNTDELQQTLALKENSYETFLWIKKKMRTSHSLSKVKAFAEVSLDTENWVKKNYNAIPNKYRPLQEEIPKFSFLLCSYFHIAFILNGDFTKTYSWPKKVLYFVLHDMMPQFSISLRKVSKADKHNAEKMMLNQLIHMTKEVCLEMKPPLLEKMLEAKHLHEPLAMCAYANDLLQRQKGQFSGAPVLVLWRKFAWNSHGNPKKNFKLTTEMILNAETTLKNELMLNCQP